ncbi:hypothetical protein C8A01DRAFT_47692 [Parachaetomium inaequale]|uniref:Uncharacterized protein n=1 Tax=Parachaetomium inaequale TaxID=2588326 RepID=A0AAN6PET3_9PEZI|nr:hypothetical protein C8A01DRAFT_47692 [Parachaetomium inaequale]
MLIKQPPSSSPHVLNPQLHTRKNHHTYNGALHLPESTHVQVIPHHLRATATTTTTTTTSNNSNNACNSTTTLTKANRRRYLITLYYAHNRACELRRSADDVLVLRQALDTAGCAAQGIGTVARLGEAGSGGSSSSSSPSRGGGCTSSRSNKTGTGGSDDDDVPAEQRIPCPRTCSCLCPCAVRGPDVQSAMEVNYMLGAALKKVEKGDVMARVAVEWFLRRRIGDCGDGW